MFNAVHLSHFRRDVETKIFYNFLLIYDVDYLDLELGTVVNKPIIIIYHVEIIIG